MSADSPTPERLGASEHFEAVAELFYAATGMLAPGKSEAPEVAADPEERDRLWRVFSAGRDSTLTVAHRAVPRLADGGEREAVADTARLDWLQQQLSHDGAIGDLTLYGARGGHVLVEVGRGIEHGSPSWPGPTLRDAIDAARAAPVGPAKGEPNE